MIDEYGFITREEGMQKRLEAYGPGGRKHLGSIDPVKGTQRKLPEPGRNIEDKIRSENSPKHYIKISQLLESAICSS